MDEENNQTGHDPDQATVDMVRRLMEESRPFHETQIAQLEANRTVFLDGCRSGFASEVKHGIPNTVINCVQPAVLSAMAVMTQNEPRGKFDPVESGEPAKAFLTPEGARRIRLAIKAGSLTFADLTPETIDAILTPYTQLPEGLADDLRQLIAAPASPADFKLELWKHVVFIDDATSAEIMQQGTDSLLEACGAAGKIWHNKLMTDIAGWAAMVVQWDSHRNKPELLNIHHSLIRIDPTAQGIEDAAYFIVETILDLEKAKATYPEVDDEVWEKNAQEGQYQGDSYQTFKSIYTETQFQRKMVTVRIAWLRHHMYPMAKDEAVGRGEVVPHIPLSLVALDGTQQPYDGPAHQTEDGSFWTGTDHTQEDCRQLHAGEQIYLCGDREVCDDPQSPNHDGWPCRPGVRQVIIVGDQVIGDEESPYQIDGESEIPVLWNKNLPTMTGPYGQGEPERLGGIQDIINDLASSVVRVAKYNQASEKAMPASVRQLMGKHAESLGSHPGRIFPIPDDLWRQFNGELIREMKTSDVSPGVINLLQIFKAQLDKTAGNTAVVQGQSDYAGQSGEAIRALQSMAVGPMGLKSKSMEYMVRRLYKLTAAMLVNFLPDHEWNRLFSRFPAPIIEAFRHRISNMRYDVRIRLVTGDGVVRPDQQQQPTNPQTQAESAAMSHGAVVGA